MTKHNTRKTKKPTGMWRTFVMLKDNTKPIEINQITREAYHPVKWVEVSEINVGSVRKPNKQAIEIKMVWEEFEMDGSRMTSNEFFKRYF